MKLPPPWTKQLYSWKVKVEPGMSKLLGVWRTGTSPARSSAFKLPRASPNGGRLANKLTHIHRQTKLADNTQDSINAIFYVDGVVGQVPTKILLDTGATVSVARYDFLQDEHQKGFSASPGAVGANGTPLDVVGKVQVPVSLGLFNAEEEFTVTQNLTVNCLLGADFLQKHGHVMDCQSSTLSIGISSRHCVPIFLGQQQ